jgi:hypothetical protein
VMTTLMRLNAVCMKTKIESLRRFNPMVTTRE